MVPPNYRALVARIGDVDTRTVQRFLSGKPVRPAQELRIRRAMRELRELEASSREQPSNGRGGGPSP